MRILRCFLFLFFFCQSANAGVESIRLLSTGAFRANYADLVEGGGKRKVFLPIPVYLIQHERGTVLFDSGLGTRFDQEVESWWLNRLLQLPLPYYLKREETAVERLSGLQMPPSAVRAIVISHLHFDHAGGIRDFPEAEVVVSRAEWERLAGNRWLVRSRGIIAEQLEGAKPWIIDYQPGTALGPFEASYDLFGDGSILLISTPGHTPGHQSLLVTLKSGKKVLLTGDAVWVGDNYLKPAPKGWKARLVEEDEKEAWRTTLMIRQFHEENPDILIIPGHDPDLWKGLHSLLE